MRDTKASFMKDVGIDDTPLTFGKYKGRTPRDVARSDPDYIVWMHANVLDKPTCSRELALDCENSDNGDHDEMDSLAELRLWAQDITNDW